MSRTCSSARAPGAVSGTALAGQALVDLVSLPDHRVAERLGDGAHSVAGTLGGAGLAPVNIERPSKHWLGRVLRAARLDAGGDGRFAALMPELASTFEGR